MSCASDTAKTTSFAVKDFKSITTEIYVYLIQCNTCVLDHC